jgi:CHAD domain-containing protein
MPELSTSSPPPPLSAHREVETKFAVERSFTVPPLGGSVPGVAAVDEPAQLELAATYYDTADLRLAREGITLRRRTGGTDAGWHLKLPDVKDRGGRVEIGAPLGAADEGVPGQLADLVAVHVRAAELQPVGVVRTVRTVRVLRDDDGAELAELVDDDVRAEARNGTVGVGTAFRELELELRPAADPKVSRRIGKVLAAAGAERRELVPKLVRALGAGAQGQPEVPRPPAAVDPAGPAHDLVEADVRTHVRAIMAFDPLVRRDEPDSVHKMRVSVRRLRSTVRTFGPLLDPAVLEPLETELKWLADVLGEPRDREVMLARLRAELAGLPAEQVLGPVAARFDAELFGGLLRAREAALAVLRGERYLALIDTLVGFAAAVSTTAAAEQPADEVLRALVRRSWRTLARRVEAAISAQPQHDELYHRARKAAKRTRYAAEACIAAYGEPARVFAAEVTAVQEVLGEHQDSVVARDVLRTLALHAHAARDNAYTYGLLAGRERCAAHTTLDRFRAIWPETKRPRYRRWLAIG